MHRMVWRSITFCLISACIGFAQAQDVVTAGTAKLLSSPKSGDRSAPSAHGREGVMLTRAAPTNQWYSSLLFSKDPQPLYAQPLTGRATAQGFEMALPIKAVVPTERKDNEIHYPHRPALTVRPMAFEPTIGRLAQASDWAIDIAMGQSGQRFDLTMAHGSPYVWGHISSGNLRIDTQAPGQRMPHDDTRVLLLQIEGQRYAVFGPEGVRFEAVTPQRWVAHMPADKRHFVLSALPDDSAESLSLISRHAYVRTSDTRVNWHYDAADQQLRTRYHITPQVLEGEEQRPLQALYPHHWHQNTSLTQSLGPAYATVRGPLKLLASAEFETRLQHKGFVPWWPSTPSSSHSETLVNLINQDLRDARRNMLHIGKGPYWQGKGLLRTTKLLDVVQVQGSKEQELRLIDLLKGRIEEWFAGTDRQRYFHLDRSLGTVLGYPEEYFSIEQMNDHHFHYGYWIRAMAELALRDPDWASPERWGGMVPWLIKDIATAERGRADFPFLRHFDVYEGHSWASGVALGDLGNNQESSSEAINAWVGLILWAEIHGDTALRDLGVYLYNTEIEAIRHYWFDVNRLVFPPEYPHIETSMLFGGGYKHNTWWTDEPRQIKGINLLPITTASTYLGLDPKHTLQSLATLPKDTAVFESRGKKANPKDIWQDLFAKYMALTDPAKALSQWERWGSVELGESRTHTLHYLMSLQSMGTPDFSIHADTPLHAVFNRPDGTRHYLAFNADRKAPRTVRFSNGVTLTAPPGTLAQTSR